MELHKHPTFKFSSNPDYDFEIRTAIGHAQAGAAEIGEVLSATAAVGPHDHKGWFAAWNELSKRLTLEAELAADAGHRLTAAQSYLRSAVYSGTGVNAMSSLSDGDELVSVFRHHRAAWESFLDFAPIHVEHIEIPYETGPLPGYFFRPPLDLAHGASVVAVNGSDGSIASLWATVAVPALARGYNVLLFDGPGQQSQLFEFGVPFRPYWEEVLTPVYDRLVLLPGVDPTRICLFGISQGGYWVARALAFEHRFAAAVADPGVVTVSASWLSQVPKPLVKLLDEGKTKEFDREMAIGMKLEPSTARAWRFRARPYGASGYAETLEVVRRYTVVDVAKQITTPLLITDPEGEPFWPGQSEQLAELTSSVSTLIHFTNEEGAGGHCEPLARGRVGEQIFDWLDGILADQAVLHR